MKTIYENFNDLKEAAEKLGHQVSLLNDNRAVVFTSIGTIPYIRGENGGWRQGGI